MHHWWNSKPESQSWLYATVGQKKNKQTTNITSSIPRIWKCWTSKKYSNKNGVSNKAYFNVYLIPNCIDNAIMKLANKYNKTKMFGFTSMFIFIILSISSGVIECFRLKKKKAKQKAFNRMIFTEVHVSRWARYNFIANLWAIRFFFIVARTYMR